MGQPCQAVTLAPQIWVVFVLPFFYAAVVGLIVLPPAPRLPSPARCHAPHWLTDVTKAVLA
jgi:hypothetical protein